MAEKTSRKEYQKKYQRRYWKGKAKSAKHNKECYQFWKFIQQIESYGEVEIIFLKLRQDIAVYKKKRDWEKVNTIKTKMRIISDYYPKLKIFKGHLKKHIKPRKGDPNFRGNNIDGGCLSCIFLKGYECKNPDFSCTLGNNFDGAKVCPDWEEDPERLGLIDLWEQEKIEKTMTWCNGTKGTCDETFGDEGRRYETHDLNELDEKCNMEVTAKTEETNKGKLIKVTNNGLWYHWLPSKGIAEYYDDGFVTFNVRLWLSKSDRIRDELGYPIIVRSPGNQIKTTNKLISSYCNKTRFSWIIIRRLHIRRSEDFWTRTHHKIFPEDI